MNIELKHNVPHIIREENKPMSLVDFFKKTN